MNQDRNRSTLRVLSLPGDSRLITRDTARYPPRKLRLVSKSRMRAMHKDNGMRRVALRFLRERDARADRTIVRELFEVPAGRRSAPCTRAVSAVSAVNAAGDSVDPLGAKASIPLAGKCRREGCVSKRHFAASGVARRFGGGDVIAREEPRG